MTQVGQRYPAKEHARKVIKELVDIVGTGNGEVREHVFCYDGDDE